MEQNYPESYVLKPSIKKGMLYLFVWIVIGLAVMGFLVLVNKYTNFLAVFNFLEFFDIESSVFIKYAAGVIVFVGIAVLLLNYILLKNISYSFYRDRLVLKKTGGAKEIHYSEITHVSYETEGNFIENLFNFRTIIIILADIKNEPIKIRFVENVEQNVRYIRGLIEEYKYKVQSGIHQEQKYE